MNDLCKISAVLFILINYSCATQSTVSAQREYVSTQVFYDQLDPYGQWIDNSNYGYVWIPNVDQNFSPYSTSGYWVMTEYGWTWVSDYPWGWAPFHYGRWDFDNYYGWFWVPDNEWGPSWVTWRRGNGYYGWTPMRPGISINNSFGTNYHDLDHWHFVQERDFGRHDMYRYYANRRDYNTIIVNSTVINNTYVDRSRNSTYIAGPSRNDVQRVTGRKISTVSVRDNDRPGQEMKNSQMQIYRPKIQTAGDRNNQPVPTRITNPKDIRPAGERNRPLQGTENNIRELRQYQPQQQNENQRQSQPAQQTEWWNQDRLPQTQQQDRGRQGQPQLERQTQQKQQINNQIQEQVKQQKQRTQQQVEKQQQNTQRQVQQQKRSNQEQQEKQQNKPQHQLRQKNDPTDPSNTNRRNRLPKATESTGKMKSY